LITQTQTPKLLRKAADTGTAIDNTNIKRYLGYVASAGKKAWDDPGLANIADLVTEASALFARTPESRAALDAENLYTGLNHIIMSQGKPGVQPAPEDVLEILAYITDAERRKELLSGIPLPSGGSGQWQPGILANREFADRLPVLDLMRNNIVTLDDQGQLVPALKSMQKMGEKDFSMNWNWFWSEMYGILEDGSRRLEGVQYQPGRMPFGASKVKAGPTGDGKTWAVQYLDDKGKIVHQGTRAPKSEIESRVKQINKAMEPGKTAGEWMKLPADVQRAFMSDMFLGIRPAGWWRNAQGATTMLMSSNTWTTKGIDDIMEHVVKLHGYVPEQYQVAAVTEEMAGAFPTQAITGSGAISYLGKIAEKAGAKKVGKGVQKAMQNVYSMPYGLGTIPKTPFQKGELRLPFDINIPFSEENLRIKSHYVAQIRALDAQWEKFVYRELVPEMQAMGIDEQHIDLLSTFLHKNGMQDGLEGLDDVLEYIETGAKWKDESGNVVRAQNEWYNPIGSLDIPFDTLPPKYQDMIQQKINNYKGSYDPADLDYAPLVRDIKSIITMAKDPAADILSQVGSGVAPVWTRQEMVFDAEDFVTDLIRTAKKAGVDPQEAKRQAEVIRDTWMKAQDEANSRVRGTLERAAGKQAGNKDVWNVAMDFWRDMYNHKIQARRSSDKAARAAVDQGTPEAWDRAWQDKLKAWTDYGEAVSGTADHYRGVLGRVYRGDRYDANFDWNEVLDRWAQTNFDEINRLMDVDLPSPSPGTRELYKQVVDANRTFADNAMTSMFEVFRQFPSMENYDLTVSAMRLVDDTGGQVRKFLDGELERLRNKAGKGGGLGKYMPEYRKIVNENWRLYWKFTLPDTFNAYSRAMVANSLSEESPSLLQWVDDMGDAQYQLIGPSTKKGYWDVRDVDTNRIKEMPGEDHTLQKGAVARAWDFVPQNVLDDYKQYVEGIAQNGDAFINDTVEGAQQVAQGIYPIPPEDLAKQNKRVTDPDGYRVAYEEYMDRLPPHMTGAATQPRQAEIGDIPAGLRGRPMPGPTVEPTEVGPSVIRPASDLDAEYERFKARIPKVVKANDLWPGDTPLRVAGESTDIMRRPETGITPRQGGDITPYVDPETDIVPTAPGPLQLHSAKPGDRVLDQVGSGRVRSIEPDGGIIIDMDDGTTAWVSPGYSLIPYPEDAPSR
jgi:hypothetical protein